MPKVTLTELNTARDEVFQARAAFAEAEPEFVDAAALQVTAAMGKYNTLIRLARQEGLRKIFQQKPIQTKESIPTMLKHLINKSFSRCLNFFTLH